MCIEASKGAFDNRLCIPLYGALTLDQQERALSLDPDGRKRIIFSTNITETSLTVEGITCVIDSGLEKKFIYDPASGMSRLQLQFISKASAEQRKGRAGRLQAGKCIRLWSETKHFSLQDFHSADILHVDLSSALLELCQWGLGDYLDINWLTPPPRENYNSAKSLLHQLELIDSSGQLTPLGKSAVNSGLSPRLSVMLFGAGERLERGVACELAALLSETDIFIQYKNVDIIDRLLAVQDYKYGKRTASKNYPLKPVAVDQLLNNADIYRKIIKIGNEKTPYSLEELKSVIGMLLLRSFPERLAKRRQNSQGRYLLANGRGASLHAADSLIGNDWLIIAECDDQNNEGRVISAAEISEQMIFLAD